MEQVQHITPLVSIIMPTYNRAGYIVETIQCILAQTYTHWELLVLDDGSNDNTQALTEAMADGRIKYFKFDRTGITGKLKNFGIREAKGELIAFMDSDDIWPSAKLEKQVNAQLANLHAGFSFTNGFNFTQPYIPEVFFYPKTDGIEAGHIFNEFCSTSIGIRTPTLLFWKYCIKKTGFFNENRLFTDFSFIGQLCYHFDAVIIYEPLFYRRLHPGNNFNSNSYDDYLEYFETIETFINHKQLSLHTVSHTLFLSHIRAGDVLFVSKKNGKAISHYSKAWKLKPYSIIPLKRIVKTYLYSRSN